MRMFNLRRVAIVAIPVLGLLATMTPPANATVLLLIVFQGDASLSGGLSYPCAGAGAPDPGKCPDPTSGTIGVAKVAGTDVLVNGDIGGNSRGFGFRSGPCVGVGLTTLPSLGLLGGPGCTIEAFGTVTGSCGLSWGSGTYTIDVGYELVDPRTTSRLIISGDFKFVGIGGTLVVTGLTNTSPTSQVVGVVEAVPVPDASGAPAIDNSCGTKSADEFTIAGSVVVVLV